VIYGSPLSLCLEDFVEEQYFNVAFTLADWVKENNLISNPVSALTFDLFNATAITNMFDAFATGPTGIYDHIPFMTVSQPLRDMHHAIEFVAHLPDHKLIYGLESVADADQFAVDLEVPVRFILKYAIIPVDEAAK
jgi:hypothetical protein